VRRPLPAPGSRWAPRGSDPVSPRLGAMPPLRHRRPVLHLHPAVHPRPAVQLHPAVWRLAPIVLALALAGALAGCARHGSSGAAAQTPSSEAAAASGFEGGLLPAGLKPREFTLTDQYGQRTSLSDFRGGVVILAFLYSTSKSAAPLIGQQIRGALDELSLERQRPAVPALAVSVDPAGDTPARVRAFLHATSLTGRLRYLTGGLARLRAVWRAYRVVPASAGERAYERGAFVALLDRRGAERVEIPLEQLTPEALAHDVRKLEAL
jgi:cytochrome oxidase Cu insertion factor (SCO1/SenC/PrrC family)